MTNNPSPSLRRLFFIGGGGRALTGKDGGMEDHCLSLAGPNPRIAYIPTATGDSEERIRSFLESFGLKEPDVKVVRLFDMDKTLNDYKSLKDFLADRNLIYVGGGNTANLLAIWRVHNLDNILREKWERGEAVMGGRSAGAICWSLGGTTDSFGGIQPLRGGLGLVPLFINPHHDEDSGKEPALQRRPRVFEGLIDDLSRKDGRLEDPAGLGIPNGVAGIYTPDAPEDERWRFVQSDRPELKGVTHVRLRDGNLVSELLPIEQL